MIWMEVTVTEFKSNIDYYLDLVEEEDIWITRNGKTVAKLVDPKVSSVDSISGILKDKQPSNLDRYAIREERISGHEI